MAVRCSAFLFFIMAIQCVAAINTIISLDENDILGPKIQAAALFAVEDHNFKEGTNMKFVRVDKAAYEEVYGSIFYLILELQNGWGTSNFFMETSVWNIPSINFKLSVGLHEIYDSSSIFYKPDRRHEYRTMAEFAVEKHNREKHTRLELVNVLGCAVNTCHDYHIYTPSLLIRDQEKQMIFETSVTRHIWDNFLEATDLKPVFEYSHPSWISTAILDAVSWKFVDRHRISVLRSLDSTPIPVIKNLDSVRRLSEIAIKLGVEKTRDELIPFLGKDNENVPDSVLVEMAERLELLLPYIGGIDHAHVLLPPLEALCKVEHLNVRNGAMKSLFQIGSKMKQADVVHWFTPLVKRLAAGESFSGRVASCGLVHIAYQMSDKEMKAELCLLYRELSGDETPIVRRSAASYLSKFASYIDPDNRDDLFTILRFQLQSVQLSVRLSAVKGFAKLVKVMKPQDYVSWFVPLIDNLSQDKFWRVRCMVAKQINELCEAVVPGARAYIVPAYIRLLHEKNVEVRMESAKSLTEFCRMLDPQTVVEHILPHLRELSFDSSEDVRAALASVIMGVAPVVGVKATNEHLVQILRSLLEGENPDVQLNIICSIDNGNQFIAPELVGPLVSSTSMLVKIEDGFVRIKMIKQIRALAYWMMVPGMSTKEWDSLIDICNHALSRPREVPVIRKLAKKALRAVVQAKVNHLAQVEELGKAEHVSKRKGFLESIMQAQIGFRFVASATPIQSEYHWSNFTSIPILQH